MEDCQDRVSPEPPHLDEYHLCLPAQIPRLLGAVRLHKRGMNGQGVRVAMIDSGFYPHPYYVTRGYRIRRIKTERERNPHIDEYGHGTALLASFFAVAPGAEVLAIKCMERDPTYALSRAFDLKPDVLCCAWGFNVDHCAAISFKRRYRRLHVLLKDFVESGITVVAAAGNGQRAFPGCLPEVIAAGGVYYGADRRFQASDISSSYESKFFPGRHVPDVCGIIGQAPHGRLYPVPVPPQARLARRPGFAAIDAGWANFSGTSAASAMTAGAAAVLIGVAPHLSPLEIKNALIEGASIVKNGVEKGDRYLRLLNLGRSIEKISRTGQ